MRCFGVGDCGVAVQLVTWAVCSGSGGAWTVPGRLNMGNLELLFVKAIT